MGQSSDLSGHSSAVVGHAIIFFTADRSDDYGTSGGGCFCDRSLVLDP